MKQNQIRLSGAQTSLGGPTGASLVSGLVMQNGVNSVTSGSNIYQHQQRKLNYSPVMKNQKNLSQYKSMKNGAQFMELGNSMNGTTAQVVLGRNTSKNQSKTAGANDNSVNFRLPGKRAQSKTDQYDQNPQYLAGTSAGGETPIGLGL